jgi:chromosome segregation ATPase
MSSGEGEGDLAQIKDLAWDLYKTCKDSSDEFKRIAHEVANLHVSIKETEEHLEESKELPPTRSQKLYHLKESLNEVLSELKRLLDGYESLGTQAQRTWDRMRWGLVRFSLSSYI